MKIAQVAPQYESVPPKLYGGTERVVAYLSDELVRVGHEVTLFASGDSVTKAQLVPVSPQGLRLNKNCIDPLVYHILMLEQIYQRAREFDVLHFHTDYLHFSWARHQTMPAVTTLHGRLDLPDLIPLYQEFLETPVISISDSQRQPLPWLNWQRTIYHGLPENLYPLQPNPGRYFAFLGRISPEKGIDQAIEIAKRCGIKLRIAAKVDRVDEEYFKTVVKPLLNDPLIEFIGEIGDAEKADFLGHAIALLAPVNWAEPFGLVLIEAMACGTPVVAYNRGSIPEIVDNGLTGYVVRNADEAVAALSKIPKLSRRMCRHVFEQRFTAARMAKDYLKAYEGLRERAAWTPLAQGRSTWTRSSA